MNMKKILIYIAISCITLLSLNSCGNNSAKRQREKDIKDSIARVEFIKDSIAKVEFIKDSIANEKIKTEIIKNKKKLFKEKVDEFQDVTWVEPKKMPSYRNRNGIYTYFAMKDNKPSNFRFVFQYYNEDWLFIKSMIFNIDGENITITPKMERDCGDGMIWEWCDIPINYRVETNGVFIEKLANAKTVKIRLNGSQYYDTKVMTKEQIQTIKDTYEYYKALGGAFY